jgi:hypothetical protein
VASHWLLDYAVSLGVPRDCIRYLPNGPAGISRYVARRRGHLMAVYPMNDDPANRARCPSKIAQLMALGVPIIAEAVGLNRPGYPGDSNL